MENLAVILGIVSTVCGALLFAINYMVSKPIEEKISTLNQILTKLDNTIDTMRIDAGNMRSDIRVLEQKLAAAFKCIDRLTEEIKTLKEKQ